MKGIYSYSLFNPIRTVYAAMVYSMGSVDVPIQYLLGEYMGRYSRERARVNLFFDVVGGTST
ncbi:MAG: hypothetical protein HXS48_01225 [Theionarchaea archaeon]|nr:MAG: hypothetical protein AYK19_08680 [Theionarchaea archaeon DG-70-1]MBU7025533.1 hypothetical protein [Theionarchaea archaeon]